MASTTGLRPGPELVWYSGSKVAMINLTKGLALEFARSGVRINAVNPMIGETPSWVISWVDLRSDGISAPAGFCTGSQFGLCCS